MPELPDVESFRTYFIRNCLGRVVSSVSVLNRKVLYRTTPDELEKALVARAFSSASRHGKYLFAQATQGTWVAMHFGMTGGLQFSTGRSKHANARVWIDFSDGTELCFFDQRMFGRIWLIDSPERFIAERKLGPDALTLSWKEFRSALGRKKGALKPALMDQRAIAGLGNIYADEALFQAGLHPLSPIQGLAEEELKRLYRSIKIVIKTAVSLDAEPERFPKSWLIPVRKKGSPCPRCGDAVETLSISNRTAYFCPACQGHRADAKRPYKVSN